MPRISINISLTPDGEEEQRPDAYQNISYALGGLKKNAKIDELNDFIYGWIKKQKK